MSNLFSSLYMPDLKSHLIHTWQKVFSYSIHHLLTLATVLIEVQKPFQFMRPPFVDSWDCFLHLWRPFQEVPAYACYLIFQSSLLLFKT